MRETSVHRKSELGNFRSTKPVHGEIVSTKIPTGDNKEYREHRHHLYMVHSSHLQSAVVSCSCAVNLAKVNLVGSEKPGSSRQVPGAQFRGISKFGLILVWFGFVTMYRFGSTRLRRIRVSRGSLLFPLTPLPRCLERRAINRHGQASRRGRE